MKILLTIILLFCLFDVSAQQKFTCYDTRTDDTLQDSYCLDQRSFQSTYRAAVYDSLTSQHVPQTRLKARVAQSAYISLMNRIDDRVIARIEQLARRSSAPERYQDVVEEWLVEQYQRHTLGLPDNIRKKVTSRSISNMLSSLGDQYAVYPVHSEQQYFFDAVEDCECVSPVSELDNGILYVQIRYHANITHQLVDEWLTPYFTGDDDQPRGLIIDVRGNPGGLVHSGIRTASLFLSDAPVLILSDTWGERDYATDIDDITGGVAIAILANGDSASAAEAMILALRENDRVVVFGSRTYGKARIQASKILPNGEQLLLTTGRYLSASGVDIDEQGISPDVEVRDSDSGCTLPNGKYFDAVICAAFTHLSSSE